MPKEHSFELPPRLMRYAIDIAGWQLDAIEQEMLRNPNRYTEYAEAREHIAEEAAVLIPKLGGDGMALETYNGAYSAYAVALASEMYLRGILDGACMNQAFIHHELPRKEDAQ